MTRAYSPVLPAVLAALAVSCSGDDNPLAPGGSLGKHRYVNQVTGNDANDGSSQNPWATITHAVAAADTVITIHVAPGDYTEANGEIFPIFVRTGQTLLGDLNHRGDGTKRTRIQGEGAFSIPPIMSAALVPSNRVRIAGFYIESVANTKLFAGVLVSGARVTIDHNTFPDLVYAGVAGSSGAILDIHDNVMHTSTYGALLDGATRANIQGNTMDTGLYGMRVFSIDSLYVGGNTMATSSAGVLWGTGRVGVIRNNTFSGAGFLEGGILVSGNGAIVRENTFLASPGIYINTGLAVPNVGTTSDRGLNNFSGLTSGGIKHSGQGAVTAIGNAWAHDPPLIGTDIIITSTGTVVTQ